MWRREHSAPAVTQRLSRTKRHPCKPSAALARPIPPAAPTTMAPSPLTWGSSVTMNTFPVEERKGSGSYVSSPGGSKSVLRLAGSASHCSVSCGTAGRDGDERLLGQLGL